MDAACDVPNPLEDDFFKAMNAYRAARASGDEAAIRAAEDAWREKVRAELGGNDGGDRKRL